MLYLYIVRCCRRRCLNEASIDNLHADDGRDIHEISAIRQRLARAIAVPNGAVELASWCLEQDIMATVVNAQPAAGSSRDVKIGSCKRVCASSVGRVEAVRAVCCIPRAVRRVGTTVPSETLEPTRGPSLQHRQCMRAGR